MVRDNKKKTTNKQTEAEAEPESEPAEEAPQSPNFTFITNNQLEQILKDNQKSTESCIKNTIKSELSSLKQEIIRLQSELETTTNIANNALKQSDQLIKDCTLLKEENSNLKAKLQNTINEQDFIYEVIEDSKNRQLRKTLVFKGIPEEKYEVVDSANPDGSPRTRPESWDDTATILATSMAESLNTTFEDAQQMVERCHRAAPNPRYKGVAPRPIFAAFVNWRDSERTKEAYRKNNIANSNPTAFVENKFGPRTTMRRNLALKERKRLIDNETIYNGYVRHPAQLMVKDSRVKGAKYKLWRDFSKEPVKLDR